MADANFEGMTELEAAEWFAEHGNFDDWLGTIDAIGRMTYYQILLGGYMEGYQLKSYELKHLMLGLSLDTEVNQYIGMMAYTGQLSANDPLAYFNPIDVGDFILAHGDEARVAGPIAEEIDDFLVGGWDWLTGGRGWIEFNFPNAASIYNQGTRKQTEFDPDRDYITPRMRSSDAQFEQAGDALSFATMMGYGSGAAAGARWMAGRGAAQARGPLASVVERLGTKLPLFRTGTSSNNLVRAMFGRTERAASAREAWNAAHPETKGFLQKVLTDRPFRGVGQAIWSGRDVPTAVIRAQPGLFQIAGASLALEQGLEYFTAEDRQRFLDESIALLAEGQVPTSEEMGTPNSDQQIAQLAAVQGQPQVLPPSGGATTQPASQVGGALSPVAPPVSQLQYMPDEANPLLGISPFRNVEKWEYNTETGRPERVQKGPLVPEVRGYTGNEQRRYTMATGEQVVTNQILGPGSHVYYRESHVDGILDQMNSWELAALEQQLDAAGLMQGVILPGGRGSGIRSDSLRQGFRALLSLSNQNDEAYEDFLPKLIRIADLQAERERAARRRYVHQPYVAQDPVAMAQQVEGFLQQRLGRQAEGWELKQLSQIWDSLREQEHDVSETARYQEWLLEGRLEEEGDDLPSEIHPEDYGYESPGAFDAEARFAQILDRRYEGETDLLERQSRVRQDQNTLMRSVNQMRSMMRGA